MEDDLTFPQMIDGLSAPIASTTADGRVDFANRQFVDYVGMSLEELSDWETSGVVHPDDLPRVATVWRQSLEWGEPYEADQRIRHADGIYQWVHVRGLPLRVAADWDNLQSPESYLSGDHSQGFVSSSPTVVGKSRNYVVRDRCRSITGR
jgi:PAS domain S-box-containing protein